MSHDTWAHKLVLVAVRPLARTAVTPNQVTTARLITGLAAVAMLASGETPWVAAGGALYIFSMLLDRADGLLARLTGTSSRWGHVYDLICDYTVTALLFLGIGVGLRDGGLGWWAAALGLIAGVSVTAIFWIAYKIDALTPPERSPIPGAGGFDPDDTLFVAGPLAWLGWLQPFLILAAVGAPLFLVIVTVYYLKLRRRAANA